MSSHSRAALGLIAVLATLASCTAPALGASQTWSPTSTKLTLSATNASFTSGALSFTCPTSTMTFTTAAAAQSTVSTAASNVTFAGGCTSNFGVGAITTSGTWGLTLSDATTVGAGGGATATCGKAGADSCTITIAWGGWTQTGAFSTCTMPPQSVVGHFTDTNTTVVINDNTLTWTGTGFCPTVTTANFTGTYTVTTINVTSI